MNWLKYLVIGVLAVVLSGCGQDVIETLKVTGAPPQNAPGSGRSIVILPFADYSEGNIESARRRNMTITESMTDRLVSSGFSLPIQEDIFDYLVKEDIIQLSSYQEADTTSLDNELADDWSSEMKDQIRHYKAMMVNDNANEASVAAGTHGLTQNSVAKIGRYFMADYVVRGRILEFKTRDDMSWAPWKKGLLPFVNGGINRVVNGVASSAQYDERNEIVTGAFLGGIIGYNNAAFPWSSNETLWGMADGSANTVFWGAVGSGLGEVSYTSGKTDQAVVQMRVWVQEATTGNIIWTNRIRVQVSPKSVFADNQYDGLFDQAIEKGVTTLIDNFVTYGL